ncbi:MAG: Xaa-Pro aminopeptidase [Gaiellaceae bacterium]|jgi:Xaa-Pro aminopeptidase|nr:Xaa-Pro aminopeptidase [Gaiellaceae bacterium]
MPNVLIFADSARSPELRHEVPLMVPDPFLYFEQNGRRGAVISAMEADRIAKVAPHLELIPPERFGIDEIARTVKSPAEAALQLVVRACRELGITDASVPASFPLEVADTLRAAGIEVTPQRELFDERRRSKNDVELEGIRRAQRSCDEAMGVAATMLRSAEPGDGGLVLGGKPLTSERIKLAIEEVFSRHGCAGDEMIVSHGEQSAVGHDMGTGQIRPDESIVIDIFPRDRESGCYADMTRSFVVGTPPEEIAEFHRLCKEALDRCTEAVKPGVTGRELMEIACAIFDAAGQTTPLNKKEGEVMQSGFYHSLGHGVGLEVHEEPSLGRMPGNELVPGDVITIEPGLYHHGFGGVRLEDLILVTEDGYENLTKYPYDLAP